MHELLKWRLDVRGRHPRPLRHERAGFGEGISAEVQYVLHQGLDLLDVGRLQTPNGLAVVLCPEYGVDPYRCLPMLGHLSPVTPHEGSGHLAPQPRRPALLPLLLPGRLTCLAGLLTCLAGLEAPEEGLPRVGPLGPLRLAVQEAAAELVDEGVHVGLRSLAAQAGVDEAVVALVLGHPDLHGSEPDHGGVAWEAFVRGVHGCDLLVDEAAILVVAVVLLLLRGEARGAAGSGLLGGLAEGAEDLVLAQAGVQHVPVQGGRDAHALPPVRGHRWPLLLHHLCEEAVLHGEVAHALVAPGAGGRLGLP
mmetsp:Transcript_76649/g.248110  ORF Transcript_76649/g.248110 Transcript_76649/m.248110 type:complete len:307 (-) Transcript_76649:1422-2342(-)